MISIDIWTRNFKFGIFLDMIWSILIKCYDIWMRWNNLGAHIHVCLILQMKLTHLVNWWANDDAKYTYNYVGTEKLHLETWYSTFYSATRDICSNFDLLVENCWINNDLRSSTWHIWMLTSKQYIWNFFYDDTLNLNVEKFVFWRFNYNLTSNS